MSRSARTQQQSPQNWSQSERDEFAAACNSITVPYERHDDFERRTDRLFQLYLSQHGKKPTRAELESVVRANIATAFHTRQKETASIASKICAEPNRFHGHYVEAARLMMFITVSNLFDFLRVFPCFLSAEDERDNSTNSLPSYLPNTPPEYPRYPSESPPAEQEDISDLDSLPQQNMQRDTEIRRLSSTRLRSSSRPKKTAIQSHRLPLSQTSRRTSRVTKPTVNRSDIRRMIRESQKPQGRLRSKR